MMSTSAVSERCSRVKSQPAPSPPPVRNHLVCVIFDENLDLLGAILVLAREPAVEPFPVFSLGALVSPPPLDVEGEEPALLFTDDDDGLLRSKRPPDLLEAEAAAGIDRT